MLAASQLDTFLYEFQHPPYLLPKGWVPKGRPT